MKTLLLSIIAVVGMTLSAQAQKVIAENAVGIRLSPGTLTDIALSYQHQMISENNRIELNLGIKTGYDTYYYSDNTNTFLFKGYYHWVFNIVDKLNWYAGPGAGVLYSTNEIDSKATPLIGAEGGVEYSFDFPLQVSLSIRPTYRFYGSEYNNSVFDAYNNFKVPVGIGARYTF